MSERHVAKDLVVPENIRLLRLPPDAPKLNSQEHIWLRKRFDKIMDLHFTFRGVSPMIILIIAPAPLPQGMRTRGLTHLGPTVENPYPPSAPQSSDHAEVPYKASRRAPDPSEARGVLVNGRDAAHVSAHSPRRRSSPDKSIQQCDGLAECYSQRRANC